jgi:hypothetical protein
MTMMMMTMTMMTMMWMKGVAQCITVQQDISDNPSTQRTSLRRLLALMYSDECLLAPLFLAHIT